MFGLERKFNQGKNHLIHGTKPIMVCLGTFEDFGINRNRIDIKPEQREQISPLFNQEPGHLIDIQYTSRPNGIKDVIECGTLEHNGLTYVIGKEYGVNQQENFGGMAVMSEVDSKDKFSEFSHDCLFLIVSGKDKKTGDNLSFLSHQSPRAFMRSDENKEVFISSLRIKLNEIKSRCEPGTIDVVMAGGEFIDEYETDFVTFQTKQRTEEENFSKSTYLGSVKLLSNEVQKLFGFEPIVVNGPKMDKVQESFNDDNVYFDNQNARLYLLRSNVNKGTDDFIVSKIGEKKHKW